MLGWVAGAADWLRVGLGKGDEKRRFEIVPPRFDAVSRPSPSARSQLGLSPSLAIRNACSSSSSTSESGFSVFGLESKSVLTT